MMQLLLITASGALVGGVIGTLGRCASGTCPLTSNPWMGAVFGAVMAFAVGFGGITPAKAADADSSSKLVSVSTEKEFKSEVLKSKIPVVVDFYADWCPPCKRMLPVMEELSKAWDGKVKVVKVNVDNAGALAQAHKVSGIPDVRIFNKGKQVGKHVGFRDKAAWDKILGEVVQEKK